MQRKRLLITLYLYIAVFLHSPFLYLSLFFRQHRDLYYEKLSEPRKTGDWESWLNFFTAALGRSSASALAVLKVFKEKPVLNIAEITRRTGFTKPTAISSVNRLIDIDILKNISEKRWGQIYAYSGYIDLLR